MAEEPIEPEIVDPNEVAVDLRRPNVPVTVEEIAALGPDEADKIIRSRAQIITSLRKASIQQTRPSDWVLYKDVRTGRVIAYLEDKGAQRIMPIWGIEVTDVTEPRRQNSEDGTSYAYSMIGHGVCHLTKQRVRSMEGVRYSTERFAQEQPDGLPRENAVKKAARANLEGRIVRNLAGLNGVPLDELITVTGIADFEVKASKGRGYGTQAERQGAEIQQSDIAKEDEPVCPKSDDRNPHRMNFVPGGVSKASGKPYDAFWSCSKHKKNPDDKAVTLRHSEVLAEIEKRKASSQQPPPTATDQREPGSEG